jgi:phage gpG-like protein
VTGIQDVLRSLDEVQGRVTNARPAMKRVGEYVVTVSRLAFRRQADPVTGGRWAPLADSTIESRRNRSRSGTKILQDTTEMKDSVHVVSAEAKAVTVGSHLPRARVHNEGASIPGMVIRPKRASALRFTIGGKVVFAKSARIGPRRIVQRRFLGVARKDVFEAARIVQRYIAEGDR